MASKDEFGEESDIPPLVGIDDMSAMNCYYGAKFGTLPMAPHGREAEIKWPAGTRHIQMERAPSGHWLVIVSHFDRNAE